MKTKILFAILCAFALSFSVACQPKVTETPEPTAVVQTATLTHEQILTIGIVSDDAAAEIEGFQPLMDYMAGQLSDLGILQGEVIVTPDSDTMVEKLKSGEVDLYYESPYAALYAYNKAGAIPLLRGWRKGLEKYHSIIFVKKDSGIATVNDLPGKLIAFSEEKSTTGHYLPAAYLISSGFTLSEQSSNSSIPAGEVGYIITGSADNTVAAVLQGKAPAGAEESSVYDNLTQEEKDQVSVIAQTLDLPRSLLMASPTMNSSLRQRVVDILIEAGDTEEGIAVLKGAKKTAKFDKFPLGPQGTMEFLQGVFEVIK